MLSAQATLALKAFFSRGACTTEHVAAVNVKNTKQDDGPGHQSEGGVRKTKDG